MEKTVRLVAVVMTVFVPLIGTFAAADDALRSATHQGYAEKLWTFLGEEGKGYREWTSASSPKKLPFGPPSSAHTKTYLNRLAAQGDEDLPVGAMIVTEHLKEEDGAPLAISVWVRAGEGYDKRYGNWYWAHFLPKGKVVKTSADKNPFAKRGFVTFVDDGRLWVFPHVCEDLVKFCDQGELAKHVIRPAAGPAGMTIRAPDDETILRYIADKPGFEEHVVDGRLWVFKPGSKELAAFKEQGELAKHVIRPAVGPLGVTVKAPDAAIIDQYLTAKPGFETRLVEGRLWVFKEGSKELAEFDEQGELAKHVIRPSAGPGGVTIKAPDAETLEGYMAAQAGFETKVVDGRVWVFRSGSPELAEFNKSGEPAKYVIRPGAGPLGMTVKAPDAETVEAYLRVASQATR